MIDKLTAGCCGIGKAWEKWTQLNGATGHLAARGAGWGIPPAVIAFGGLERRPYEPGRT